MDAQDAVLSRLLEAVRDAKAEEMRAGPSEDIWSATWSGLPPGRGIGGDRARMDRVGAQAAWRLLSSFERVRIVSEWMERESSNGLVPQTLSALASLRAEPSMAFLGGILDEAFLTNAETRSPLRSVKIRCLGLDLVEAVEKRIRAAFDPSFAVAFLASYDEMFGSDLRLAAAHLDRLSQQELLEVSMRLAASEESTDDLHVAEPNGSETAA